MAFQYLDSKNVFDAYADSQKYMRVFFETLDEYERIARNKPHPGIDKTYPKVTDGTTSSIIQKTPRRIIQQLPTGKVVSDTDDWLSIVASFIYLNKIIPNANMQFALLQKCWLAAKFSLTNGSATAYTPFVSRGSYMGPDMTIPYVKDILYQKGKVSSLDSSCKFMRSWYQPSDIDAEIHRQRWLKKQAAERGEKYESSWNLSALAAIKDEVSAKTDDQMSRSEKEKHDQGSKGGIEVIHAFQEGIGADFISFHPGTKKILRVKENKDPRGKTPLDTMYADVDGYNPVGWGLVEQLAALQNLLDSDMQMYQFERALMLAPPTIKRGNWSKSQAKLAPNVIVDLGSDPNASWEVLKRDSSAMANYATIYGLMKSQLLNIASSPDTSISSEIGNPGFSKTDSGVKQIAANVSVDDNYIRKQFETFFSDWSETAINLYFAERTGVEELQLDKETALKLRKIDDSLVSDDDKVRIDYTEATDKLRFEVDASTSNMKDNIQQLEALDGLLGRLEKSTVLQGIIPPEKVVSVWNSIVSASGVEDPEKVTVDEEEFKAKLEAQAAQEAEAMAAQGQTQAAGGMPGQPPIPGEGMPSEGALPPEESLPPVEGLPPGGMEQPSEEEVAPEVPTGMPMEEPPMPEFSEEDMAFIEALREMGYSDNKIGQAMAMEAHGIPEEEIISVLEGVE